MSRRDEDLVGQVLGTLATPVREDVMDLIEMFAEKKRDEVRAEERRAVVLKLLTLRFGPPTDAVRARVETANVEQLDHWIERVLSAEDVESVLAD